MQGPHRLLNRCLRIEAVTLQHIDVVELEAFERLLHRVKNMLQGGMSAQQTTWDEGIYLAAEAMLIRISYLVELGVRFSCQRLFHIF